MERKSEVFMVITEDSLNMTMQDIGMQEIQSRYKSELMSLKSYLPIPDIEAI